MHTMEYNSALEKEDILIHATTWMTFCYRAGQGVVHNKLLEKGFPLSVSGGSFPHTHLLGSKCPPLEERRLSMPETGEKERNCLFKSYTDLE